MASRIVIFDSTGLTGNLTVQALVENGQTPLLVGRSQARLKDQANRYGGLDYAVANASAKSNALKPESLNDIISKGDVLVALAGPFVKVGYTCLEAAISTSAHYLDSTGEPPFIRCVFEQYGPRAKRKNIALLTAMGYDYVPGNLAAAHALQDAGPQASRIKVGYFVDGSVNASGLSGGTRASLTGVLLDNSFRRENGVLETERPGVHFHTFDVGGRRRGAVSLGASEHFTVPQEFPQVRSVETYLGWFGPASRAISITARTAGVVLARPAAKGAIGRLTSKIFPGSTGGPGQEYRATHRTLVIAQAFNDKNQQLAQGCGRRRQPVRLHRPDARLGFRAHPDHGPEGRRRARTSHRLRDRRLHRRSRRSRDRKDRVGGLLRTEPHSLRWRCAAQ